MGAGRARCGKLHGPSDRGELGEALENKGLAQIGNIGLKILKA